MSTVKKTSIADINRKTAEFNKILVLLEQLSTAHNSLKTLLDITFSSDCKECHNQSEFIKLSREMFKTTSTENLTTYLYNLNKALTPNETFPLLNE